MVKVDLSSVDAGLAALAGPIRASLARRMLVAAGQDVRDEAKLRALQNPKPRGVFNESSRGSQDPGTLSRAVYLAYDKKKSTETFFQYNVSWNDTTAWWGKLKEFGWLQTNVIAYNNYRGTFYTVKGKKLKTPIRHPADPFLAPAYDTTLPTLFATMTKTGQRELPLLLAEYTNVS